MISKILSLSLFIACISISSLRAQDTATEAPKHTAEELAKMAQNPLANMMSFPFQNNTTFGKGPNGDRTSNVFNIQPVLPFFNGHLITRTIIPIVSAPNFNDASGASTGIGDISSTFFISPGAKNGLTWGLGPTFLINTNNNFSSHKFGLGVSFLVLKMTKKFVYGFLVGNTWSVAGDPNAGDVNSFLSQYFVNMNFPKGWYISSAPILTANWEAAEGEKWVIPFGGGGGKIVKLGKIPLNLQVQAFWNAIAPTNYGSFSTRLQVQILLPK